MPKIALASSKSTDTKEVKSNGLIFKLLNTDISLGKKRNVEKKKLEFYNEMSALLGAGVDIKDALEIVKAGMGKGPFSIILNGIYNKVIEGNSLSEALQSSSSFSRYETESVKIGEESGFIEKVFNELSVFYQKRADQKRKISGALTYPILVLMTAIGAVFVMMRMVVPMFEDVFKRFNNELPALTKRIISISHWLGQNIWVLFIGFVVLLFLIRVFRKKDWFRKYWHIFLLRIPFFGDLTRKMFLARFCTSMELLMSSQTPIVTSMELVRGMISYYPLEFALKQMEADVISGIPLYKSMQQFPVFDQKMMSMIRVGEEVNQLSSMFAKLRELYEKEVDHRTSIMGSVLEPLIIILVGAFVGFILIAMYLPMFKMSSSFGS